MLHQSTDSTALCIPTGRKPQNAIFGLSRDDRAFEPQNRTVSTGSATWSTQASQAVDVACARAVGSRYDNAYGPSCEAAVLSSASSLHAGELWHSRTNRSQCDEKRPTCGNCKKSGRECPGYPDEFDLVFRDENKAMARKARKVPGPALSRSSPGGSSSQPSPNQ